MIQYTHFFPALDVFPYSLCSPRQFFRQIPCPTSLNSYPSHCQLHVSVHQQNQYPISHWYTSHISCTFLLPPQSCSTNPRIRLHLPVDCHPPRIFPYPWLLLPNTGKIPDKIICPAIACHCFHSSVSFDGWCLHWYAKFVQALLCRPALEFCAVMAVKKFAHFFN